MTAPFRVERDGDSWTLVMRRPRRDRRILWFDTQGDAIDYAYRHWPWWP